MTDILTESFCERCGAKFTFETARRRRTARLGGVRTFARGIRNYVLSDESLDEALAEARRDRERSLANHQLEAFHSTFNFCIDCRQYTCTDCWNEAAGRCQSCAPYGGQPAVARPMVAEQPFDEQIAPAAAILAPAHDVAGTNGRTQYRGVAALGAQRAADVAAWPTSDLTEAGGQVPAAAPHAEVAALSAPAAQAPAARVIPVEAPVRTQEPGLAGAALSRDPVWSDARWAAEQAEPPTITAAEAERMAAELERLEAEEAERLEAEEIERRLAEEVREEAVAMDAEVAAAAAEASVEAEAGPVAPAAEEVAVEESPAAAEGVAAEAGPVAAAEETVVAVEPAAEEAEAVAEVELRAAETPEVELVAAEAEPVAAAEENAPEVAAEAEGAVAADGEPLEAAKVAPQVAAAEGEVPVAATGAEGAVAAEVEAAAAQAAAEPAAAEAEPIAAAVASAPEVAEPLAAAEPALDVPATPLESVAPTPPPVAAPALPRSPAPPEAPPPARDRARPAGAPPEAPAQPVWQIVAPEEGQAPTQAWPPRSPVYRPPAAPPAPPPSHGFALFRRHAELEEPPRPVVIARPPAQAVWDESSRGVLGRPGSGVQACVSCGLPLSASARFCRRCGSRQD